MKGCLHALLVGFLTMELGHLEVSARGQAIGFQPIPAPFPSGAILDVTPAVSADRRYVRMSLGVSFSELSGFTTYSVPAAVSGGGAGMNGPIGGIGGAGGLGGLGGANSVRSVGLGGPTVAGAAPGLVFGPPAGDPFKQALRGPSAVCLPASSSLSLSQEESLGLELAIHKQASHDRNGGGHPGLNARSKRVGSLRGRPRQMGSKRCRRFPQAFFPLIPDL